MPGRCVAGGRSPGPRARWPGAPRATPPRRPPGEHRGVQHRGGARDHGPGAPGDRDPRRCGALGGVDGGRPRRGRHGAITVRANAPRRRALRGKRLGGVLSPGPRCGSGDRAPEARHRPPVVAPVDRSRDAGRSARLWGAGAPRPPLGSAADHLPDSEDGSPRGSVRVPGQDLFGKHGVPVVPGAVARPRRPPVAARRIGGRSRGQGPGQAAGAARQAGSSSRTARTRRRARAPASWAWTSRATPCTVCSRRGGRIAEEYYVSFLLDRANRAYLAMARRGRDGHRAGRRWSGRMRWRDRRWTQQGWTTRRQ